MTLENTLDCNDTGFTEWTTTVVTGTPPNAGEIEQVQTSARNGGGGLHATSNGEVARAQLDNWTTPMLNLGDIRAVGYWVRLQAFSTTLYPEMIRLEIGGTRVVKLVAHGDGRLRLTVYHDGGTHGSSLVTGLETLNKWYYIQVVLIRHATEGGGQVYLDGNLVIDETALDTSTKFGHVITASTMYAGSYSGDATFEIEMDEFRIATTVAEAGPRGGGNRMMMGVGS